MRVKTVSLALAVITFLLVGVVEGEEDSNSEELQPELEPQAHTLFEKEDPIDPEAHGVFTLFESEEELGRQARSSVLKTKRSLYKILRKKSKNKDTDQKPPKSASRRRSLYSIVRKKPRKPAPVIPPPEREPEGEISSEQDQSRKEQPQNMSPVQKSESKRQEADCETRSLRNNKTEDETKDESQNEPDGIADDGSLKISGGRYRRSNL